jgi:hypothetical protein
MLWPPPIWLHNHCHQYVIIHVYILIGLIGPTKYKPHFMNGSFGRIIISLAKFYVANPLMH